MISADLDEISMAASYVRHNRNEPATFILFVRALPPGRGFLVAAGLETALRRLSAFRIPRDDLPTLARLLGCPVSLLRPLAGMRFTGTVVAVPEGRVVLAGEPLLEITAPLPQAQLVESVLLNAITYQTAVATKAVRCVTAAGGRSVMDVSLRHAYGLEAADEVARLCAIAGFVATSNARAAARFELPAAGTMAHSFVEAFGDDEAAFRALAAGAPRSPTFLVDTFDLTHGVQAAARVITDFGVSATAAVRIGSGDPDRGARLARSLLDSAGLPQVKIVVSGKLDEHAIAGLRATDAPIDVFAVSTTLDVDNGSPALDSTYELTQLGHQPMLTLSPGTETAPGTTQIWRRRLGHGPVDLLTTRDEAPPADGEPLLLPAMHNGRRLDPPTKVTRNRERLRNDLALLPPSALDLDQPRPPHCDVSPRLERLIERARQRTFGPGPGNPRDGS